LQLIVRYVKPYFARMSAGITIKLAGTLMDLALPWILAKMIDDIAPLKDMPLIALWGLLMLLCAALGISGNVVANRMAAYVAREATRKIRHDLFAKIASLSCRQVDELTVPSLESRLTSDTYYVHSLIGSMQRLGVRAPILMLGGMIVTLSIEPQLALVLLAVMPLIGLIVYIVSKKGVPLFILKQKASDVLVRTVRENITGIRVIKAFAKESEEMARFDAINKSVAAAETRAASTMAASNPLINLLLNYGLTAVIIVGAFHVNSGIANPGEIIAFLSYFTIMLNAMLSITRMFVMMTTAIASAGRIQEVLSFPDEMPDAGESMGEIRGGVVGEIRGAGESRGGAVGESRNESKGASAAGPGASRGAGAIRGGVVGESRGASVAAAAGLAGAPPHIEFRRVSFSYARQNPQPARERELEREREREHGQEREPVREQALAREGDRGREPAPEREHDLAQEHDQEQACAANAIEDISFAIGRGETLGIIGSTGSGKSTLISMLMRLYEPGSGNVLIDGIPVGQIPKADFYRKFGAVFQRDVLFADTIRENIDFGRELGDGRIDWALGMAQAAGFVGELPDGLSHMLSQKGTNISGGQKQRLLLARAFAGRPEILVLDDSSSALDYRTDSMVRRAIREQFGAITSIVIAQRISSVMGADRILVLEDGKMLGYGRHEELLATCGVYREIAALQMDLREEILKEEIMDLPE
jgi:ATP-binding cassette subfamily B protein